MKYIYILLVLFSLSLIGCSSTYTVTDFASKEKFYEDFNNSAGNKSLKIILDNDSTISADDGARISNDSLFITLPVLKQEKVINKDDIEDIKVSIHDMTTTIVLKNDKSVTAGSIDILPDSSVAVYNYENSYKYLSLNNVKEISYKNHWLGVPIGFVSGIPVGLGAGYIIASIFKGNNQYSGNNANNIFLYIFFSSPIIGGIWGWITGWTYTYGFAP